jgi:hypothetical protein
MLICQRDFIDGEVERGIGSVEHARRAGVQGRMSLVPTSRPELDIALSTHDELSPCPGLALGVSDCTVGEISHAVRRSRCGDGLPLGSPGALWPSRWLVHRSTGGRNDACEPQRRSDRSRPARRARRAADPPERGAIEHHRSCSPGLWLEWATGAVWAGGQGPVGWQWASACASVRGVCGAGCAGFGCTGGWEPDAGDGR